MKITSHRKNLSYRTFRTSTGLSQDTQNQSSGLRSSFEMSGYTSQISSFSIKNAAMQNQYFTQNKSIQSKQSSRKAAALSLLRLKNKRTDSDSLQSSPYSSKKKIPGMMGVSSRSTLDQEWPNSQKSYKSIFLGHAASPSSKWSGAVSSTRQNHFKTPSLAINQDDGTCLRGSPQPSPAALLRDASFYRQLMSSRGSFRKKSTGRSDALSEDEFRYKRVLDTYRSSKHSLFTLVQNEVCRESVDQLDLLEVNEMRRKGRLSSQVGEEEETAKSLQKLNGEYKEMHNKLNRILNGDRAEGATSGHILLADGATGRFSVQKGSSLFFKVERRNMQLGILRVIAKMDGGEAKLYASCLFEFPNYANNALKHSSMVVRIRVIHQGETCYFTPEESKAKTVYLSVEAQKKTTFTISVKFVKHVETHKKILEVVNVGATQQQNEQDLLSHIRKESASGNLFKAFMGGKLDEQARQEVMSSAQNLKLENLRMMRELNRKVRQDLYHSHYGIKWQRKKEYFEKQRYRSEQAKIRKGELLQVERKRKVALVNKSEIYRYLKHQEMKRLRKLKQAEFFIRAWVGAERQMAAFQFLLKKFTMKRDAAERVFRENMAARQIQIYYSSYVKRTIGPTLEERSLVNFRQGQQVRCAMNRDIAHQVASQTLLKFLSDMSRIRQLTQHIETYIKSIIKIQIQWRKKALKNRERVVILKYYADRLCDCYLQLKKRKIPDQRVKRKVDKKLTLLMGYDVLKEEALFWKYCSAKKALFKKQKRYNENKYETAPSKVKKFSKVVRLLALTMDHESIEQQELKIERKLSNHFSTVYKRQVLQNREGFFKKQINLAERANKSIREELKQMEAQGKNIAELMSMSGIRKKDLAPKKPKFEVEEPSSPSKSGNDYEKYIKEMMRKAVLPLQFEYIPEVEEFEEILKINL